MIGYFPKSKSYLTSLDLTKADPLDLKANELIGSEALYEKASQALRRRFSRGAQSVDVIDRGERQTILKREKLGGKFKYVVQGADGGWFEPEERIWVVAMYALWQDSKKE